MTHSEPRPNVCGCISSNVASWGGHRPPVLIQPRPSVPGITRAVAVDACIAPLIDALWDAGIATCGSCCGHGQPIPQMGGMIYVHLSPGADLQRAIAVARRIEPVRGVRYMADALPVGS